MEINKTNNLSNLLIALDYFYNKTKIKPTYEYVLLKGVNDSVSDAQDLIKFCHKIPCKINLIEYNKVEGLGFSKSSEKNTELFMNHLDSKRVNVGLRRSRGKDINAACGQLANKK